MAAIIMRQPCKSRVFIINRNIINRNILESGEFN